MAPLKTAYAELGGLVSERLVSFFSRRAKGGIGLIISEPLYVDRRGCEHPRQLGIDDDDKITGLRSLVTEVHGHGSLIFAHLNHAGRAANPQVSGGVPEAPSDIVCPRTGVTPEILTLDRITHIIDAFATAAFRAQKCGFDGIELQFGMGYLVSQFYSPAVNNRTDQYGGPLENRLRLAREIFKAVRTAVGPDFPISIRMSGSEKTDHGMELEDAMVLAKNCEAWGADLIHVATGSNCESLPWYFQHMALPEGVNESLAAQIKNCVTLPVMAAGRLGDPARIREVLASELVDLIAIGRGLLADPDLPLKMAEQRDDEVVLCGQCLQGCFGNVKAGKGIGCNINPGLGFGLEESGQTDIKKTVAIVGGGPAGMQAALTAWRRGHRVILFEKNDYWGGQFELAHRMPKKQRMASSLKSIIAQLERSDIEIHLGQQATAADLKQLDPDVIIIATGSHAIIPGIEGLEEPLTDVQVLTGPILAGDRMLVLGGGMIGLELAEYLATNHKQVVVIEKLDDVAQDMDPVSKKLLLNRLNSLPVEILTSTELVNFSGKTASVHSQGHTKDLGHFDQTIVTVGHTSYDPLSDYLDSETTPVMVIGDADKPARIYDAVIAGHRVAMSI